MPITYRDLERAKAILVLGLDAEQELPILHLRLRKAAKRDAKIFVVHPRRTRLWDVAEHVLCRPGEEADVLTRMARARKDSPAGRAAAALADAGEQGLVLAGPRLADSPDAVEAAERVSPDATFVLLCRRANDRGALRAGVHPGLLPGGRPVDDPAERAVVESAWGTDIPIDPGRDTAAILRAAAVRELDVLFLIGVDPLRDFPDAGLARRALENVPYKVVVDVSSDAMSIYADAMFPALPYLEKDGHYTDWEGRAQRLRPVRPPMGLARPEWEIFQELSEVLGADMGFSSLDGLHEEMASLLRPAAPRQAVPKRTRRRAPSDTPTDTASLVLFSYPLLIDEGRLSVGANELKDALEELSFLEVHPTDAERLELADGALARLSTAAGAARLPVRVSDGIAPGAAFVPWNQPALAANTLFSGAFIAQATVEPVSEGATAEVRREVSVR